MRISDWSSDVCSSDLRRKHLVGEGHRNETRNEKKRRRRRRKRGDIELDPDVDEAEGDGKAVVEYIDCRAPVAAARTDSAETDYRENGSKHRDRAQRPPRPHEERK